MENNFSIIISDTYEHIKANIISGYRRIEED
jgi:hypothetical protein